MGYENLHKWVGNPYKGKAFSTKFQLMKEQGIFLGEYPIRVAFRFCIAWIMFPTDSSITTVCTPDRRRLIGYDDPYMLTHGNADAEAFVNALSARNSEKFVQIQNKGA